MDRIAEEAIAEVRSQFAGEPPEAVGKALRAALNVRNATLEYETLANYVIEISAADPPA